MRMLPEDMKVVELILISVIGYVKSSTVLENDVKKSLDMSISVISEHLEQKYGLGCIAH